MEQFPSNTHKSKEATKRPVKKVEKVVTTQVVQRKKSFGAKLKEVFVGGEARTSLHFIGYEVVLPAIRNLIVEATTKGIERMIYGDSFKGRSPSQPGTTRISYNQPVQRFPGGRSPFQPNRPSYYQSRSGYEIIDPIFATKEDADSVLEMMINIAEEYDAVSVQDLHELAGLPSTHIDNKWGWSNLAGTEIKQVREGFIIDFPPVESF